MLINSVEVKNFRQFYGQQKIQFSTDSVKNITLIHAENGVGKTALLNAILWCFYAKTTDNFERKKDIQNHHAKKIGKKGYYVFITFEEDSEHFVAQRQVNSLSGGQEVFRVYKISDSGDHKEIPTPEVFINDIIPKDMAGYFFFQGEGVGALANNKEGDVKEAIWDILGFTIAKKALEDILKVKGEYRRELAKLNEKSDLGVTQERLANCEDKIRKTTEEIDEADKNKRYLDSKLKSIEEDLKNSDSQVVSEKQKSRESKKAELETSNERRDRCLERKSRLVGKYAVSAFCYKAANDGIDFIDEKELKGTVPAPYNVQLVKDILTKGECICGSDIKIGTEAYGKIQSLLKKATNPTLLNRVRRARSQLTVVKKELQYAETEFKDTLKELSSIEESIATVEAELETLSLQMKGSDIDGIKEKEESRTTVFQQLQEVNRTNGSLTERKSKLETERDTLVTKEKRFKSTEPQIIKLRGLVGFIEEIQDRLDSVLKKAESDSLVLLEEKINKFLDLYVKQDFRAEITKDFEIVLCDRDKRPVAKSDGQSLLLSLTFISSLISLAKDRENAPGTILTRGAVAPFVIDAPFGVLDKSYKANIAEELPKSVKQVVFLLSSSHWEGTVEDAIRKKIGREYNMVLEVATDQKSKEVGSITILGKNYETVKYNSDVDMTRVEEVGNYV